ncbi:serine/threonine-protein phosphatase Pgam5, mitochondrial isoform X1 [Ixodes scapularis]|uniref:Serine/threonine-protein phosphatase PGAM5, mitochondrial n=1 Tax=Ixodes scapularis TaxID=6945 RepID=A0A4D5RLB3_IXOSC|nr:serine/threonine-protein phosphatase Pgam5, mitochondrial isoform X1 [Ixodes scapularis]
MLGKAFAGIIGGGIATFVVYANDVRKNKAHASWTTNASPSTKWDKNWDRRDPESCVKPAKNDSPEQQNRYNEALQQHKPTAIRHLYLIRHGQYNLKGDSDRDLILTELGRKQADVTGQRLKQLNVPFSRMVFSTMARATETARIIHGHFEHLPLEPCELIREGAPIPPEPPSGAWKPEAKVFFTDGARIEAGFRKYFYRASPSQAEDSHEIIVCHANVIRYWICRALQFPPEGWLRFSLTNCSISVVSILPSGRVLVRTVGDSGHLPKDMITTN